MAEFILTIATNDKIQAQSSKKNLARFKKPRQSVVCCVNRRRGGIADYKLSTSWKQLEYLGAKHIETCESEDKKYYLWNDWFSVPLGRRTVDEMKEFLRANKIFSVFYGNGREIKSTGTGTIPRRVFKKGFYTQLERDTQVLRERALIAAYGSSLFSLANIPILDSLQAMYKEMTGEKLPNNWHQQASELMEMLMEWESFENVHIRHMSAMAEKENADLWIERINKFLAVLHPQHDTKNLVSKLGLSIVERKIDSREGNEYFPDTTPTYHPENDEREAPQSFIRLEKSQSEIPIGYNRVCPFPYVGGNTGHYKEVKKRLTSDGKRRTCKIDVPYTDNGLGI